jgi:hypothetical protein
MKKLILSIMIAFMFLSITAGVEAYTYVRGYYRSSGTYVQPYYRTSPNYTRLDNWSTKGNYNPYTGSRGYTNPYRSYYWSY